MMGYELTGCTSFEPALISKGLRRKPVHKSPIYRFRTCPDFKGIKTLKFSDHPVAVDVSNLP